MKKTIDYLLLIAIILITLFGAYMILSATYYFDIYGESNNPMLTFLSDFKKIGLGFIVMIIAVFIDMKFVKRMAPVLMVVSMVLLLLTHIIGEEIYGSKRWLFFGDFSFAPSELCKVAAVLYFAKFIEHMPKDHKHYQRAWFMILLLGGMTTIMIILQPDLSSSIIYCCGVAGMLIVGGGKLRDILLVTVIVGVVGLIAISSEGYRVERMTLFKEDDITNLSGDAAQVNQSLMAIAEGGVHGVGPGKAYQTKFGHAHSKNDFIFATVAETTGFIGSVFVVGTYIFILYRMTRIALLSQSTYGVLVTTGIMSIIASQSLMHLLVNTKSMPVTGVTLPFISSGGSSTIIMLGAVGLVLNLSSNPKSLLEK